LKRRRFFTSAAAGAIAGATARAQSAKADSAQPGIVIERAAPNKPHQGKALALITPHLDDGPIFAGGTLAKLLNEGYTGYFIRTSNDEKDSYSSTLGETVLANERDAAAFVKAMGLKRSFDLGYRNHRMDDVSRTEIRGRLIFLFRLLKIDAVLSYDPWGHYEENPDHYVTAQAVEAACWMAAGKLDFPEHFAAGLKPQTVSEKYYFARGPQLVNRVVDITTVLPKKLAERKLQVSALSGENRSAVEEYMKIAFVARDRAVGERYGLEYAEEFHYIGPDPSLDDYILKNARPL
jgi:LmbE family N-acetylglucosaminyl deacetylase